MGANANGRDHGYGRVNDRVPVNGHGCGRHAERRMGGVLEFRHLDTGEHAGKVIIPVKTVEDGMRIIQ